jgi:hypothetical protein
MTFFSIPTISRPGRAGCDGEIANGIDVVSNRYGTDSVLDFVRSMNAERFETAWVAPKLSAVLPRLQKTEESFRSYNQLFSSTEGEYLRKLPDIYEMKPSKSFRWCYCGLA